MFFSIINYRVSISEISINKVSKELISYLNISFSLKTGIWKKLVNNNKYSLNSSFSISNNKIIAFLILFLLFIFFFLFY
jgi:hypothetical protein